MKRILWFMLMTLPLLVLNSCDRCEDPEPLVVEEQKPEAIFVRFINSTGAPLEKATINETTVGNINAGETTDYIKFEHFGVDMDDKTYPREVFVSYQKGELVGSENILWAWCGTGIISLEKGYYTINITTKNIQNQTYLSLRVLPSIWFD